MKYILYSRPDCPLCVEAESMLRLVAEDYAVEWLVVNIEEDDVIHEKYMLMIPVLEQDGEVKLFGKIGYVDLLEIIDG